MSSPPTKVSEEDCSGLLQQPLTQHSGNMEPRDVAKITVPNNTQLCQPDKASGQGEQPHC